MYAFTLHSVEPPVERTSPPESTVSQSAVHGSVVTKWLFALITPEGIEGDNVGSPAKTV